MALHLSARTRALVDDDGSRARDKRAPTRNLLVVVLLNDEERPRTASCLSWGLCSIRWRILSRYSKRAHHVCAL